MHIFGQHITRREEGEKERANHPYLHEGTNVHTSIETVIKDVEIRGGELVLELSFP